MFEKFYKQKKETDWDIVFAPHIPGILTGCLLKAFMRSCDSIVSLPGFRPALSVSGLSVGDEE